MSFRNCTLHPLSALCDDRTDAPAAGKAPVKQLIDYCEYEKCEQNSVWNARADRSRRVLQGPLHSLNVLVGTAENRSFKKCPVNNQDVELTKRAEPPNWLLLIA